MKVERFICPICGKIKRNLPNNLEPYKHYSKEIIENVKNGTITSDILEYEDYPSEITMRRWKTQK